MGVGRGRGDRGVGRVAVLKAKGTAISRVCGAYFLLRASDALVLISTKKKGKVLSRLGGIGIRVSSVRRLFIARTRASRILNIV